MARQLVTRRGLLSGLAGAAIAGAAGVITAREPVLRGQGFDAVSRWNDEVQAVLFSPVRLAQTYRPEKIAVPFRYNGFYPEAYAPSIDPERWRLKVSGRVARLDALSLADLRALRQESQITRLICIEGWSAVGKWSGVPLSVLLDSVGADRRARYVHLLCADGYHTSIDMTSALHPQTILALDFLDRPLPRAFGAPVRLRIPTKLGFKNAKFVTAIKVTNDFPGGYWEDQGYGWFAGL